MSTLSEVAPAPILSIRELSVEIQAYDQRFLATKGIGLDLCQGEVLGLVGESGCAERRSPVKRLWVSCPRA